MTGHAYGDSREFLGEKTGSLRYPLNSYKKMQFSFQNNLIRISLVYA